MAGDGLRLVLGGAAVAAAGGPAADPVVFQDGCLLAFEASQVARGFSQTSMDNGSGVLERFLAACDRPAWDVTREDVDRVVQSVLAEPQFTKLPLSIAEFVDPSRLWAGNGVE